MTESLSAVLASSHYFCRIVIVNVVMGEVRIPAAGLMVPWYLKVKSSDIKVELVESIVKAKLFWVSQL